MEIIDRVKMIVTDYISARGMELVDIIYRREQQGMVLRLLVDTAEGVTLAECEDLNNFLSDELDKEDVMQEHFILEVSSPGLDRPIVSYDDFRRAIGKALNITTYAPVDGKREHSGVLLGMDKDSIVIESSGVSAAIPKSIIAKAVLKIEI